MITSTIFDRSVSIGPDKAVLIMPLKSRLNALTELMDEQSDFVISVANDAKKIVNDSLTKDRLTDAGEINDRIRNLLVPLLSLNSGRFEFTPINYDSVMSNRNLGVMRDLYKRVYAQVDKSIVAIEHIPGKDDFFVKYTNGNFGDPVLDAGRLFSESEKASWDLLKVASLKLIEAHEKCSSAFSREALIYKRDLMLHGMPEIKSEDEFDLLRTTAMNAPRSEQNRDLTFFDILPLPEAKYFRNLFTSPSAFENLGHVIQDKTAPDIVRLIIINPNKIFGGGVGPEQIYKSKDVKIDPILSRTDQFSCGYIVEASKDVVKILPYNDPNADKLGEFVARELIKKIKNENPEKYEVINQFSQKIFEKTGSVSSKHAAAIANFCFDIDSPFSNFNVVPSRENSWCNIIAAEIRSTGLNLKTVSDLRDAMRKLADNHLNENVKQKTAGLAIG